MNVGINHRGFEAITNHVLCFSQAALAPLVWPGVIENEILRDCGQLADRLLERTATRAAPCSHLTWRQWSACGQLWKDPWRMGINPSPTLGSPGS